MTSPLPSGTKPFLHPTLQLREALRDLPCSRTGPTAWAEASSLRPQAVKVTSLDAPVPIVEVVAIEFAWDESEGAWRVECRLALSDLDVALAVGFERVPAMLRRSLGERCIGVELGTRGEDFVDAVVHSR